MFLTTLFSSIYLLSTPVANPDREIVQAIEVVHTHHLETPDGRIAFLTESLSPFVNEADNLNREIQALSVQISSFESIEEQPAETKQEFLALGEMLNQKMASMMEILPTLQTALLIENDFEQIDAVLARQDRLNPEEKELILRIASLCNYLDTR